MSRLVGHASAVQQILTGLDAGAKAFLVVGERGVGKHTLMRHLAEHVYGSLDHEDLLECKPEKASFGIGPVREFIEESRYLPSTEYRLSLFQNVERFTREAADALLKTLEEGDHLRFIMTAVDPARVSPTILSRCELVTLARLTNEEVGQVLEDHDIHDASYVDLARGLPGRALRAAIGSLEAVHAQAEKLVDGLFSVPLYAVGDLFDVVKDELLRDLIEEAMSVVVDRLATGWRPVDPYKGFGWVLAEELSDLYRVSGAKINLRRHLEVALTSCRRRVVALAGSR